LSEGSTSLLALRAPRLLLVDEASQILLHTYAHLSIKLSGTLERVASIGDPEQLAPFGSESVTAEAKSVFDLPELRKTALFLNISYRLPKELRAFISKTVYDGKLQTGPKVWQGKLDTFLRFVDVESGVESRAGGSFKNVKE